MGAVQQASQWMGRPIIDPEHAHDLETRAAIHEFHNKLPRHKAEERAHLEYVRDQRLTAAAHHLNGMKAAQAVGDMESARQHGMMYELHTKALGLDPLQPPSAEITSKLRGEVAPKVYRFKAHKGDLYALPDVPQDGLEKHEGAPPPQAQAQDLTPEQHMAEARKHVEAYARGVGHGLTNIRNAHHHYQQAFRKLGAMVKAERLMSALVELAKSIAVIDPTSGKRKHCKCEKYPFPHRPGGGRCEEK